MSNRLTQHVVSGVQDVRSTVLHALDAIGGTSNTGSSGADTQALLDMFSYMDVDEDGHITARELAAGLSVLLEGMEDDSDDVEMMNHMQLVHAQTLQMDPGIKICFEDFALLMSGDPNDTAPSSPSLHDHGDFNEMENSAAPPPPAGAARNTLGASSSSHGNGSKRKKNGGSGRHGRSGGRNSGRGSSSKGRRLGQSGLGNLGGFQGFLSSATESNNDHLSVYEWVSSYIRSRAWGRWLAWFLFFFLAPGLAWRRARSHHHKKKGSSHSAGNAHQGGRPKNKEASKGLKVAIVPETKKMGNTFASRMFFLGMTPCGVLSVAVLVWAFWNNQEGTAVPRFETWSPVLLMSLLSGMFATSAVRPSDDYEVVARGLGGTDALSESSKKSHSSFIVRSYYSLRALPLASLASDRAGNTDHNHEVFAAHEEAEAGASMKSKREKVKTKKAPDNAQEFVKALTAKTASTPLAVNRAGPLIFALSLIHAFIPLITRQLGIGQTATPLELAIPSAYVNFLGALALLTLVSWAIGLFTSQLITLRMFTESVSVYKSGAAGIPYVDLQWRRNIVAWWTSRKFLLALRKYYVGKVELVGGVTLISTSLYAVFLIIQFLVLRLPPSALLFVAIFDILALGAGIVAIISVGVAMSKTQSSHKQLLLSKKLLLQIAALDRARMMVKNASATSSKSGSRRRGPGEGIFWFRRRAPPVPGDEETENTSSSGLDTSTVKGGDGMSNNDRFVLSMIDTIHELVSESDEFPTIMGIQLDSNLARTLGGLIVSGVATGLFALLNAEEAILG